MVPFSEELSAELPAETQSLHYFVVYHHFWLVKKKKPQTFVALRPVGLKQNKRHESPYLKPVFSLVCLCEPACLLVFALTASCVVSSRRCLRFNQIMSHGRTFTAGWRGKVRPYFIPGGRGGLRWGWGAVGWCHSLENWHRVAYQVKGGFSGVCFPGVLVGATVGGLLLWSAPAFELLLTEA